MSEQQRMWLAILMIGIAALCANLVNLGQILGGH